MLHQAGGCRVFISSFQNNVPDPVTSGKELPTFKFELEKSEGRVMGGRPLSENRVPLPGCHNGT
jgi:hypothetical protein